MSVTSRARRILAKGGHLVGYRHIEGQADEISRIRRLIKLGSNEEVLGIYENPSPHDSIVITTEALHLLRGAQERDVIRYNLVRFIRGPQAADTDKPEIDIGYDVSLRKTIPVLGRRGKLLDVFEVLRFIMRAVQDVRRDR